MSDILISITCLLVVCLSSVAALLSKHYRDNWLQFAGLWGLLFWSAGQVWQLTSRWIDWMSDLLLERPDMATQDLIGHAGLALFALGTAWKVWRHRAVIVNDGNMQRAELQ